MRHIKQLPDGTYDEANAEVENLSGKFEAIATVNAKDYGEHYPTNDAGTKQNIKIEKDLTIDVLYDLDMHTLTFDAKGGTETESITVRHGNTVAKPEDPKRSGYRFNGWMIKSAEKSTISMHRWLRMQLFMQAGQSAAPVPAFRLSLPTSRNRTIL